jgi:transcription elongation factor Elf1
MLNDQTLYPSGAASLFAGHARNKPALEMPVTCPWCLSEDTSLVDNEHGIFECDNCGEVFTREAK